MERKFLDKPRKVQKRYFRRLYSKIFISYSKKIFLFRLRMQLKYTEAKRTKTLDGLIDTILNENKKLDKKMFSSINTLHNISLFIMLAERDLQAVKIDAFTHKDPWKRNLSIRIMFLIIHERDISKVASGKIMNNIYSDINIDIEAKKNIIAAFRNMNKVQKKIEYILKDIRNTSIGHRDRNALLQYEIIKNIDILKMRTILDEYYQASSILNKKIFYLIQESSTFNALLSQYND